MKNLTTFLQIDLQNLFFEAKTKGEKIDFEKVWEYFNSRETEFLIGGFIYLIRGPDFDSSKFESKLISIGYTIVAKKIVKFMRRNRPVYRQSNHDVGITVDSIDKMNNYDKLILMSGDGDFTDLCKYLKSKKKQIEIWSFKECYNSSLEIYADRVYFIDEQFFYKKPKVKVFGFNWGPR